MSQENVKPDQIQASVAAALSRLRGDLAPPSDAPADAPVETRGNPAQPANDLRADPAMKPAQSGMGMQAPAEPVVEPDLPRAMFSRPRIGAGSETPPPSATPAGTPTVQRQVSPLARMMSKDTPQASSGGTAAAVTAASQASAQASPASPAATTAAAATPAGEGQQPDLLAGLQPPPLGGAFTEDTDATAQRRRRNRRILLLSTAIVLVVAGFWVWGLNRGGSQDVPVIAADQTPEKVKPAEEGGLQVPNQNVQVLDNMDSTQQATNEAETVLPPPEQPVSPPAPAIEETQPAPEASATDSTATDSTATDSTAATVEDVPSVTAPPPPAVEAPAAPETEASTAPAAPAEEPAAPEASAEVPAAPAVPAPTPEPEPAQAAQPEPAQPEATQPEPAAPAATQEAAVAPAPAPASGIRVQLAAVKTEAAANAEWAKLQKAHPQLLGDLSLTVQKVDKGSAGIFYRIQAGPLADRSAAKQLCSGLKQRGQDCLVVAK